MMKASSACASACSCRRRWAELRSILVRTMTDSKGSTTIAAPRRRRAVRSGSPALRRVEDADRRQDGPGRDHRPGLRRACRWPGPSPTEGVAVLGFDVDADKVGRLRPGRELHRPHLRRRWSATMRAAALRGDRRLRPPRRARRHHHLRPDAADRRPRARPDLRRQLGPGRSPRGCGPASSSSWRAPPTRARPATSSCRSWRRAGSKAGRDFFLAFSPEREDPGNPELLGADDPQGRRRPRPREPGPRRRALRPGGRPGRAASPAPRSPRRARSWRTPTAPSTSPWSTS